MIAALFVLTPRFLFAADSITTNQLSVPIDFKERARKNFYAARIRYHSETNSIEAAWQFARACFDLGEFATSNPERAEVAQTGIAAARQSVARQPASAPAHYYLAMNIGQLARTKSLGALRLVDEMETEFSKARVLDEHLDFAGPDRNLGLLYLEAPSFGSIGSRTKARQHLRRAVELEPDYPENRLHLIEAYLRWGDRIGAVREFKALESSWPQAHQKYSGDNWASSWVDWEKGYKKLKEKIGEVSKQLESPRGKN
jgi:tetratricopeptide (TPR) repeat protein